LTPAYNLIANICLLLTIN